MKKEENTYPKTPRYRVSYFNEIEIKVSLINGKEREIPIAAFI
jgi:hypothetical protein